jgi:hypothetical protein
MESYLYPPLSKNLARKRAQLTPEIAFRGLAQVISGAFVSGSARSQYGSGPNRCRK